MGHLSELLNSPVLAHTPAHGNTGRGRVRRAPAAFDEPLIVTLSDLGESFAVPAGQWLTDTLPAAGAHCLLIFDDRQDAWALIAGPPGRAGPTPGLEVNAGASFDAVLNGAPTGLVGQIGIRINHADGSNAIVRTTAGITESPAGSGIYIAALTAPPHGDYLVVWDTGGSTPIYAEEDLTVL